MAIEWRLLRRSDVSGAFELSRIAGWNQTEADWLGYLALDAEGCMAAVVDGELAGTVTSIRYGEAFGWLGMLLVHPTHRGHGLGKELLLRSIRYFREKGVRTVRLDATPMGKRIYLPLGFRDEFEVKRMEGSVAEMLMEQVPAPSGAEAERMLHGDLMTIAGMDCRAFGGDRGALLHELSNRDPDLCFVVREGATIKGYLIGRVGREAIQLGPIVASTPAVAEQLFRACFRAARGRRIFLDLPVPNRSGCEILERYGFKEQRSFSRMSLGEECPRNETDLVFGTGGAEFG